MWPAGWLESRLLSRRFGSIRVHLVDLEPSVRNSDRPALHTSRPAREAPQRVHFLHFGHLDRRHRAGRDRALSVIPHVQIEAIDTALNDWNDVAARARADPEVVATAPLAQAQAMLIRDDAVRGALISGIDPAQEPSVSDIAQHLQGGPIDALAPGRFDIVLGRELAHALGVDVGDKVTLVVP